MKRLGKDHDTPVFKWEAEMEGDQQQEESPSELLMKMDGKPMKMKQMVKILKQPHLYHQV